MPVLDLPLPFLGLSLPFHCLSLAFRWLSLTFHCLSLQLDLQKQDLAEIELPRASSANVETAAQRTPTRAGNAAEAPGNAAAASAPHPGNGLRQAMSVPRQSSGGVNREPFQFARVSQRNRYDDDDDDDSAFYDASAGSEGQTSPFGGANGERTAIKFLCLSLCFHCLSLCFLYISVPKTLRRS
jgi:hypothetical protein